MATLPASQEQVTQAHTLPALELGDLSLVNASSNLSPANLRRLANSPALSQSSQGESPTPTVVPEQTTLHSHTPPPPTTTSPIVSAAVWDARDITPIDPALPPSSNHIATANELPASTVEAPRSDLVTTASVIQFTLLLASTGTRHPFQLNSKYLSKRNVKAEGSDGAFDPGIISVYTLKELILRDWRDDWDEKPSSPSAIRLIFFGQLLSDNSTLKDCRLVIGGAPNVLHVTVKPQDFVDDEEAGKGGKRSMSKGRDGSRGGGCRCVML